MANTKELVTDLVFLDQATEVEKKTLDKLEAQTPLAGSDTANRIAAIKATLEEHSGLRDASKQAGLALAAQILNQQTARGPGGSSTSASTANTAADARATTGGRFSNK
jgi:hypothetical protein